MIKYKEKADIKVRVYIPENVDEICVADVSARSTTS